MKYVCFKCGKLATHTKQNYVDSKTKRVYSTLGTWSCKTHGKVAVRREKA